MRRLDAFEKMRANRLRAGSLSRKLAILEEIDCAEMEALREAAQRRALEQQHYLGDTADRIASAMAAQPARHRPRAQRRRWWQFWKRRAS